MSTDLPDWIRAGANVVIFSTESTSPRIRTAVVTRITQTQIVVTDRDRERRFRKATLREVGDASQTWKVGFTELRPPADPDVLDARAANIASAVERVHGPQLKRATTRAEVLEVFGWIEQAVADARSRVLALGADVLADADPATRTEKP